MNNERPDFSKEHEAEQPLLNKEAILNTLFAKASELGMDVDEADVEGWLGEDDNDFLGNLATLALMHNIDREEFFETLGIPIELPVEVEGETE